MLVECEEAQITAG